MIPVDATAVLAVVCACVFAGVGGYLLGYLEGKAHGREETADLDDQGRDDWRSSR